MTDRKLQVPQLRFPEFSEEWKKTKLGDLFKRVSEKNNGRFGRDKYISLSKMYYYDDPDKVPTKNIDRDAYVLLLGDMAFEGNKNKDYKYGRFVVNDIGDGIISDLFPVYRHKTEYVNNYWKEAIKLERIMGPICAKAIKSSGTTVNILDVKHLFRQSIYVPSLEEQQKIGNFFKGIDGKIKTNSNLICKFKTLRKSLTQKLLPAYDSNYPALRFNGFNDQWKKGAIGKNTTILVGGDVDSKKLKDQGKYPVYGNGVLDEGIIGYYDDYKVEAPSVTVTARGTLGVAMYRDKNYTPVVRLLTLKGNFDYKFLEVVINKARFFNESTGVPQLTSVQLRSTLFQYTSNQDEQKKIGKLFLDIDNLIKSLERQNLNLLQLKQALLQRMFI